MSRRSGQNGTVVIAGKWYRVRWRIDVEGQEKRINMNERLHLWFSTGAVTQSRHR